jgi:hypothetical protein
MWLEPTIDRASQFGAPGYLALLWGQRVEHERAGRPSEAEMRIWNAERERYKKMAMRGLMVREALTAVGARPT